MVHKFSILLLGIFLAGPALTIAQTPAPDALLAYDRIPPPMLVSPPVRHALLLDLSFPASRDIAPLVGLSHSLNFGPYRGAYVSASAGAYENGQSIEDLVGMTEVDTFFLSESRLPIARLWGGRLRLDGFTSTLNMQNVELGPAAAGSLQDFRPTRQNYLGGPRSIDLHGISVSLHFGRSADAARPAPIWHQLAAAFR